MARLGKTRNWVRTLCLAGTFLAPVAAGLPANAEILPLMEMLRGVASNPQLCAAKPLAVWINSPAGGFCIRYYLSTVGGESRVPTVFLQGDQFGRANLKAGRFDEVPPTAKDTDTANLQRMADSFSKKTGGPAIYLARIGVDGSSGHHIVRHSELELRVMNAALDAIRQKHGYEGFHLAGQSGGGTLVGGLLGLRADIGCAVPGSGRLAGLHERRRPQSGDPTRIVFDPAQSVGIIAKSRARILVVTDPEDKKVALKHQSTFVQQLRAAGGRAEHYFVQAIDDNRHGTVAYQMTAVAGCIHGAPTQAIADQLAEQVRTRVAAAAKIKAERQMAGATPLQPMQMAAGPNSPPPRPIQTAQLTPPAPGSAVASQPPAYAPPAPSYAQPPAYAPAPMQQGQPMPPPNARWIPGRDGMGQGPQGYPPPARPQSNVYPPPAPYQGQAQYPQRPGPAGYQAPPMMQRQAGYPTAYAPPPAAYAPPAPAPTQSGTYPSQPYGQPGYPPRPAYAPQPPVSGPTPVAVQNQRAAYSPPVLPSPPAYAPPVRQPPPAYAPPASEPASRPLTYRRSVKPIEATPAPEAPIPAAPAGDVTPGPA